MRVLQKKRGRCNNAKRCLNIIGVLFLGGKTRERRISVATPHEPQVISLFNGLLSAIKTGRLGDI